MAAANKYIGLNTVEMSGKCWMTKEIAEAEKERDRVRAQYGMHSEAFKAKDDDVKAMLLRRKTEIWEHRILSIKGKKDMWSVLRSLTTTKCQSEAKGECLRTAV